MLPVQKYLSVLYTRRRPQSFKSIHVDVNDFGLYVMYILHHSCTKKTTKQPSSYVARILSLSLFVFYIIKNHRATVMTYHCQQIVMILQHKIMTRSKNIPTSWFKHYNKIMTQYYNTVLIGSCCIVAWVVSISKNSQFKIIRILTS